MKSFVSFYLLAAFLSTLLACNKSISKENGNNTGTKGKEDFYATIDGSLWNADSLQVALVGSNGVSINGLSKNGEEVSMILPALKTGIYTLNPQSASYALDGNIQGTSNTYISNAGTASGMVTISSIDTVNHLVNGSFAFNLVNPADNTTKTITNGVFDFVPYNVDLSVIFMPPAVKAGDTLNAVIDSIAFNSGMVEAVNSNGQLTIAGIAANGPQDIALIMPVNINPGTYDLDFGTGNYIGIYNPAPNVNLYSQHSGQLIIMSNDPVAKRIQGTFSFVASPLTSGTPVTITNGYFAVSY